jgi:hypothetical protein
VSTEAEGNALRVHPGFQAPDLFFCAIFCRIIDFPAGGRQRGSTGFAGRGGDASQQVWFFASAPSFL